MFSLISAISGSGRLILLLVFSLICVTVVDTSFIKIFNMDQGEHSNQYNIWNFTLIIAFCTVVQYFILRYTKRKLYEDTQGSYKMYHILHTGISIACYSFIIVTIFVILQMITTNKYSVYPLYMVVWMSYIMSSFLLGLLGYRLISWFITKRNTVVLIYAFATIVLLVNSAFTLLYVTDALNNVPLNIVSYRSSLADFNSTTNGLFVIILNVTDILSFFMVWLATVLLLYNYSRRLGKVKYWILVSLPLVYFLSQFLSLVLNVFDVLSISYPFSFETAFVIFINSTSLVGGILFGVSFWAIAANVNRKVVKDYMIISGVGMALLFTCIDSAFSVGNASYPPFGLGTVWFVGLSSYLLFIGIYYSALAVARDMELRRMIRKSIERHSSLLDSIGTSEAEYQIRRNVLNITKKVTMDEEIQPSIDDNDLRDYIDLVIREVKEGKK